MKDPDVLSTPTMNDALRGDKPLIIVVGSSFKDVDISREIITAVLLDSLGIALVHKLFSLKLCASAHRLF